MPSPTWKLSFPLSIFTGGESASIRTASHGSDTAQARGRDRTQGSPVLDQSTSLCSILYLLRFPPKILKPPLFHIHLKDETDLEVPDVSERGFVENIGTAHSTVVDRFEKWIPLYLTLGTF